MKKLIIATAALLLGAGTMLTPEAKAQTMPAPFASQKGEISQTVGLTDIKITYFSPATRGRKVFGSLVPYDQIWRCGANENTVISFTDDVKIEGQDLAAGTYGLHMIPTANEWTLIFSKNHTSWGSYFYRKDEDALRVTVKPTTTEKREWLAFDFRDRQSDNVTAVLEWDQTRVPFKISVDVNQVVLGQMRNRLRNTPGFRWNGYQEAASYCAANNFNHEEALGWANRAVQMNRSFATLATQSMLLKQTGKATEAKQAMDAAVALGNENELNRYGYNLMGSGDVNGAISVFEQNVKQNPKSWNAYDSLAEAQASSGNKKSSAKNYKKALSMAPDDQKQRIKDAIKAL